jgi:hypothetical protein
MKVQKSWSRDFGMKTMFNSLQNAAGGQPPRQITHNSSTNGHFFMNVPSTTPRVPQAP